MFLTKVLEKKNVIQFFGIALILSPAFSIFLKIWFYKTAVMSWGQINILEFLSDTPPSYKILHFASILIGALMLKGSSVAWKYMLFVVGGHIALQVTNFESNFQANKLTAVFLFINILVFAFIVDQLVWKVNIKVSAKMPQDKIPSEQPIQDSMPVDATLSVRVPEASFPPLRVISNQEPPAETTIIATAISSEPLQSIPIGKPPPKESTTEIPANSLPLTSPPPLKNKKTQKKVIIHFEGVGRWGQLIRISHQGLQVRGLMNPPQDIERRELQIALPNGLKLRARLTQRSGDEFFFEYTYLNTDQMNLLNSWIKKRSQRAS